MASRILFVWISEYAICQNNVNVGKFYKKKKKHFEQKAEKIKFL